MRNMRKSAPRLFYLCSFHPWNKLFYSPPEGLRETLTNQTMMNYFTKRGLISALLLLLALTGARAEDFVVDGIKYSTDSSPEGEVAIVGYENIAGDVVIPSTVTYEGVEYEVTCIGGFNYSPVSSVTIPSTVRSIKKYAFWASSLNSIYFESPSSLTEIDSMAFNNCRELKSIELPNSVRSINHAAFVKCN